MPISLPLPQFSRWNAKTAPPVGPEKRLYEFTRDELVWSWRTSHEDGHFARLFKATLWHNFWAYLADMSFLFKMDNLHFENTVNKSVPIYLGQDIHVEGQNRTMDRVIFNYVFRRWYRPFRSDMYHQRYICKFIALGLPENRAPIVPNLDGIPTVPTRPEPSRNTIESLIDMHRIICSDAEAMAARKTSQNLIIQPLFKALAIFVDPNFYLLQNSQDVGRMPVFMIRTGVEDGLSKRITFESIQDRIITSYQDFGEEGKAKLVKTTLEAAIDLVLELEEREIAAYGLRPDPYTIHQEWTQTRNQELVERFGPDVELIPENSPDFEWVDKDKYPEWIVPATVRPAKEEARCDERDTYCLQRRMVIEEERAFHEERMRIANLTGTHFPEEGVRCGCRRCQYGYGLPRK